MRETCFRKIFSLFVIGLCVFASPVLAQSASPSVDIIDDAAIKEIRDWLQSPVVGMSVVAQNKRYASLPQSEVDALDKQWRAERKSADQPLIAAILSSPLSNYLTQIQAASAGLFTEIFVMDANGLNVGQSGITSDMWQGDEAKFQKTFPQGHNVVFIDEPELHDATKTWRVQVNLTVSGNGDVPIGAVTVEYNLTELARRRAQ